MSNNASTAAHSRKMRRMREVVGKVIIYLILLVVGVICAGPFIWLAASSFKMNQNIYELTLIPTHPTFSNYTGVITFLNITRYINNTVIITFAGIILDVVFSSLCAYPLAKMEFYGKKIVSGALISTMILPAAANLVVNYLTCQKLGILHTYASAIIPGGVAVFSIILIRQAYFNVPTQIIEAARIDGASEVKIWYKIMVPEIMPAISTIIIFDFVGKWNNFLWPSIVLNQDHYPIAAALMFLNGQFNYKFGYIAAGAVLSMIPAILVFVLFQKYYIDSIAGAVKG